MGSYENLVKAEQIRKKVEEGDLLSAQNILDTMDLKKVKNISDLNLLAEVYKENEKYDKATELYLRIYEKSKTRKTIGQLLNISIKSGNIEDAEYYMEQYKKTAPDDIDGYIYQYKIDKMKGASYEQLINAMETLKTIDYTEKWAYELAKLYYKAGMEEKCIRECSDIVLWFGEGIYVEKAKMLRSYFSGDADRERMMEAISFKVQAVSDSKSVDDSQETDMPEDLNEYVKPEEPEALDNTEEYVKPEEYNSSESDFVLGGEEKEFLDGLKMVFENILSEVRDSDESSEEDTNEENNDSYEGSYQEDSIEEAVDTEEVDSKEETFEEVADKEFDSQKEANEEEDLSEENEKLNHIAEEYEINPEDIFGDFLKSALIKKQLVKSLEIILKEDTKTVLMIIAGSEATDKINLAKDIALFMNKTGKLKSSKVAKITADKLNKIDIGAKKETLRDCCLVIEDAGELNITTVDRLLELIQQLKESIAVIFETDNRNLNKLFRESPVLMNLLHNRIYLPK